jgi:hypothetical protein
MSARHLLARWFLAEQFLLTLKMEAICSSKTSVDTQWTTRRYIPEDGTLHNHRCENLKSYTEKTAPKIMVVTKSSVAMANHRGAGAVTAGDIPSTIVPLNLREAGILMYWDTFLALGSKKSIPSTRIHSASEYFQFF